MDLKIKDVAELLNISETTVRRWLAEGKIPAYRINHQYRFSRDEIQNWVLSYKLNNANENPLKEIGNRLDTPTPIGQHSTRGIQQFSLYRAVHKGTYLNGIGGSNKEGTIRNAMTEIAKDLDLDAEVLFELLWDRERLEPTSLNNGIGIPHTRDFLLKTHQDAVCIVFPDKPIDYQALDNKPVHTLFFLFASEDKRHLHLLAKIALFCSQPKTIEFLTSKPSKEALLEYIKSWEANIAK